MSNNNSIIPHEVFVVFVAILGAVAIFVSLVGIENIIAFWNSVVAIYDYLGNIPQLYIFIIVGVIVSFFPVWWIISYTWHTIRLHRANAKREREEQEALLAEEAHINALKEELNVLYDKAEPLLKKDNSIENLEEISNLLKKVRDNKFYPINNQRDDLRFKLADKKRKIQEFQESEEKKKLDRKEEVKKKLGVYDGKDYFKKTNLNEEQIQLLLELGFKEESCRELDGTGNCPYILKPRHNESTEHLFLVRQVEECLKGKVTNLDTKNSVVADLTFDINSVNFAIEIETGTTLQHKDKLNQKVDTNNKKFGQNWCFVVTNNRKLARKYRKFHSNTYNRRQLLTVLDTWLRSCNMPVQKPPESTSAIYK